MIKSHNIDKLRSECYYSNILKMKKLLVITAVLASFLASPKPVLADDQICTQVYGGGVVCGAHTPVNTGIADNLGLVGIGSIVASGLFFFVSRKVKQVRL